MYWENILRHCARVFTLCMCIHTPTSLPKLVLTKPLFDAYVATFMCVKQKSSYLLMKILPYLVTRLVLFLLRCRLCCLLYFKKLDFLATPAFNLDTTDNSNLLIAYFHLFDLVLILTLHLETTLCNQTRALDTSSSKQMIINLHLSPIGFSLVKTIFIIPVLISN